MGWGGVGWLDKLKIKLSQLSTLVEVEADLGNNLDDHGELPTDDTGGDNYGTDYADDSELEDNSGPEDGELTEITTAGAAPE